MATASNFDENISCSLCLEMFDKPRVLSCGHSFCSKCLQNFISHNYDNNDKQISCPFCRQKVHIPDSTKPVETWAAQFSINKSLVDAINDRLQSKFSKKVDYISVLSSVSESLKSYKEILQTEMDDEIEQLRHAVDINVADTAEEVRRIGNTLITDFTAAVHKEQDRLIREIERSQNFVNSEIKKMFNNHKHLIDENEKLIKLGDDLLKRKSESDIKINVSKFIKLDVTTSDFLSKSLSQIEKAELKINLKTSGKKKEMSVHIGEIITNVQTDTQIDRLTDTLKHTNIIDTKTQLKHAQTDRPRDTLKHTNIIDTKTQPKHTQTDRPRDTLKHRDTINTKTQHKDGQTDRLRATLKHTDTIDTKSQENELDPCLFSILVPGEDNKHIVVSDSNNNCVKRLCLTCKSVINKYVTSSAPRGLAEQRDQQGDVTVVAAAVIALPDENQILFLNLKNFKLMKTVMTDKKYYYVSVLPGNRLAVTGLYSGQYLDILTDSGQLIKSISADLIAEPSCLTVYDQCLIVVSQRENVNSLVCVTSSGDARWESRDADRLIDLRGVACDKDGNIFVCDFMRDCVVQLSRDGNITRDILTYQEGLSGPESVCCHDNKIYVGELFTGQIQIFSWCKD